MEQLHPVTEWINQEVYHVNDTDHLEKTTAAHQDVLLQFGQGGFGVV